MYEQVKGPLINKLVEALNAKGFNISAETINKAFDNFPQLIQKVQSVLNSPEAKQNLSQVLELLTKAAKGELSASEISAFGTSTAGTAEEAGTKSKITEEE